MDPAPVSDPQSDPLADIAARLDAALARVETALHDDAPHRDKRGLIARHAMLRASVVSVLAELDALIGVVIAEVARGAREPDRTARAERVS